MKRGREVKLERSHIRRSSTVAQAQRCVSVQLKKYEISLSHMPTDSNVEDLHCVITRKGFTVYNARLEYLL